MSTNQFLPFCPTDSGTNLLSQSDYAAAADRTVGNQPGVASSKLNNKALRQGTYITSQVAQFLADTTGADLLDDNIPGKLLGQIRASLQMKAPVYTKYLSGTGSYEPTLYFYIASGNATAAATYSNNGKVFTVKTTISAQTVLVCTGTGSPSVSGTLTKTSGTGDATITFYAAKLPLISKVRAAGGGGGGTGSGTGGVSNGGDGTDTTFGTSLIVAGYGVGGTWAGFGGVGGSSSLGSAVGIALSGQKGGGGGQATGTGAYVMGGEGGSTPFYGGGGAVGCASDGTGGDANTNTGSGGAGGGTNNGTANNAGSGGGSGGFVDAMIYDPLSIGAFAYSVGNFGPGTSAGTSGKDGGDGAVGVIEVWDMFQ